MRVSGNCDRCMGHIELESYEAILTLGWTRKRPDDAPGTWGGCPGRIGQGVMAATRQHARRRRL